MQPLDYTNTELMHKPQNIPRIPMSSYFSKGGRGLYGALEQIRTPLSASHSLVTFLASYLGFRPVF